jgi:hypothetical protein
MRTKPTKNFWKAYGALYGNEITPEGQVIIKKRKKPRQIERDEQIKFNVWFSDHIERLGLRWFQPANGGKSGGKRINGKWVPIEGLNLKRMGVKKGVPDVVIPFANGNYHGLVIELKRPDGKLRDLEVEQIDWLDYFVEQNWSTHVAFGFEQAKGIVVDYLDRNLCYNFESKETSWRNLRMQLS